MCFCYLWFALLVARSKALADDNRYDVIVLGLGVMGTAATYHLARAGRRVLALEQFELDHKMGSSYKQEIIRVPLGVSVLIVELKLHTLR